MSIRKPHCAAPCPLGLTLVEVLVSLVLVTTVLLVSITASANLLRNSHEDSSGIAADQLTSQILDEIATKDFRDADSNVIFGLEPDESNATRVAFDDIDDYHNYTVSPPSHRDGTAIDGYSGWTLHVSVQRAEVDGDSIVMASDDDSLLRLITVTCTSPSSEATSQSRLVSNVPLNVDPTISHEKWRSVIFTFPGNRKVNVTAPMHNLPEVTTN